MYKFYRTIHFFNLLFISDHVTIIISQQSHFTNSVYYISIYVDY